MWESQHIKNLILASSSIEEDERISIIMASTQVDGSDDKVEITHVKGSVGRGQEELGRREQYA